MSWDTVECGYVVVWLLICGYCCCEWLQLILLSNNQQWSIKRNRRVSINAQNRHGQYDHEVGHPHAVVRISRYTKICKIYNIAYE